MTYYDSQFIAASRVLDTHAHLPVRQVHAWISFGEGEIVVVSGNGEDWHMPGGTPLPDEAPLRTLQREVYEETSLRLDDSSRARFFGYYVMAERETEDGPVTDIYLRLRYRVALPVPSTALELKPCEVATEVDPICYVSTRSVADIAELVWWLQGSEELQTYSENQGGENSTY